MFWEPGFTGAQREPGVIRAVWDCWIWQVLESVGGLFIRIHWDPGAGDTTGSTGAGRPQGELGACV